VPFAGADVSASCLMLPGSVCGDCGAIVGNRPEALPPGLTVRSGAETPAMTPGNSDVVTPATAGDGTTVMGAEASGSVRRFAALAMAVRLTAETAVAVRGMGTCAWSCRCAEVAFTAPRSHEDVPSLFPQPKLKLGAPLPAGVVSSWIFTSGTLPPDAQAATAHWAAWPGWRLCCKGATSTHTLTGAALALTMAAVKTTRLDALPAVATADGVGGGVGVGVGVDVGVAVAADVVGVGVGVTAVVETVAVGVAVVAVGVGVALVVVGDAVGLAGVFVADGLGDATIVWRGSHDSLLPGVTAAAAATVLAVAAGMPHEAAVSTTLPVTRVTADRRVCANHICVPACTDRYCGRSRSTRSSVTSVICVIRQLWTILHRAPLNAHI
jgi:hypothetical protein